MNAKLFSEAMNEVNDKYYEEAANYHCKKYRWKKWSIVAACLAAVLVLCGFCYAAYIYWGAGPAKNIDFADLTQPFGTVASDKNVPANENELLYEKSNLINDYSNVFADNSVCVTMDGNSIPPIYFSPNYMVIFTQPNEDGWTLSKGDEFSINFSLFEKIQLDIGYILNGKYYEITSGGTGPDFGNIITAPEDGIYYFCVTNRSSSNAVIKSGEITKESK